MSDDYNKFLLKKTESQGCVPAAVDIGDINPMLHPHQKAIVEWACNKGCAAIFADCGLGKTFMQIEWARLIGGRSLIFAPLFVARQTVEEAKKLGVDIKFCADKDDLCDGINITNYEKAHKIVGAELSSIVLDESSILKSLDGKTKELMIERFGNIPYKLACTATPSPNDIAEIGNHAEFLGIMSRVEMLATYFVHDNAAWRLKGHAHDAFYEWLVSWGIFIRKPSDIGFSDEGYTLPDLNVKTILTDSDYKQEGVLFPELSREIPGGISGRASARRLSIKHRLDELIELIDGNNEQFIVWTGLNAESDAISKAFREKKTSFVTVEGKDCDERKQKNIGKFLKEESRIMITKVKIAGFGMNFQNSHNMAFFGMNDSFEAFYQAIRRQFRFRQKEPVNVYIIVSKAENCIVQNVLRKEREAKIMAKEMFKKTKELEKEIFSKNKDGKKKFNYSKRENTGESFTIYNGDSSELIYDLRPESIDLSIFSPPFASLYTYSPTIRDLGNCKNDEIFFKQFEFIIKGLLRATKPGRRACVHVAQIAAMLSRDGFIGLKDFRGQTIKAFQDAGWHFYREVCIDKCPQAQAIRTKSKSLLFTQLEKDSSWSGPALADYILTFRKPGDNKAPIKPDISRDEWIQWARPVWYNIRESDTLNTREAKGNDDERHICPLQLETIERCVRLWSNKGETVFSPFMGIGSEGYQSIKLGRKFTGIELKPEYYNVAVKNITKAGTTKQMTLPFLMHGYASK